ncbi:MAG: c-type cytochrome, partial [Acidobacteriota bacterium]|nr:c-type cytochrome [Acidobacteriota bacterium]
MSKSRFGRIAAICLAASVTFFFSGLKSAAAQMGPPAPGSETVHKPADPNHGKSLFEQNCSTCHGIDAAGEEGPDLHGIPGELGD